MVSATLVYNIERFYKLGRDEKAAKKVQNLPK